jgi:hypothetical protein
MQLIIPGANCAGWHNRFTLHILPRARIGKGMQQAEMNLGVMSTCTRYTWNGYSELDEITYTTWDILRKIARFRLFAVLILQTSSQFRQMLKPRASRDHTNCDGVLQQVYTLQTSLNTISSKWHKFFKSWNPHHRSWKNTKIFEDNQLQAWDMTEASHSNGGGQRTPNNITTNLTE